MQAAFQLAGVRLVFHELAQACRERIALGDEVVENEQRVLAVEGAITVGIEVVTVRGHCDGLGAPRPGG